MNADGHEYKEKVMKACADIGVYKMIFAALEEV
jgi:hypothetical protein